MVCARARVCARSLEGVGGERELFRPVGLRVRLLGNVGSQHSIPRLDGGSWVNFSPPPVGVGRLVKKKKNRSP